MQIEQLSLFNTPAVTVEFSQDDIDKVICRGSGFCWGKLRIYDQFKKGASEDENVAFLKHEYGVGGCTIDIAGTSGFANHDGKGLTITTWKPRMELFLPWHKVAKRLSQLIASGKYITQQQIDKERKEQDKWYKEHDNNAIYSV